MRARIDPELAEIVEQLPAIDMENDLAGGREGINGFKQAVCERLDRTGVECRAVTVPGPPGAPDVAAFIYRPEQAAGPLPVFLNIHGGGFVAGLAAHDAPANTQMVRELGCIAASPDYRLAPESPAPAAVEDCYAVLDWI